MGYQGFVMSDWGATHSTVNSANNGLDMEMPDSSYFGSALQQAVNNGQVSVNRINDMVTRILVPMFAVGLFDTPHTGNLNVNVTSAQHNQLARELAEEATVLLKNSKGLLPLKPAGYKTIAVIGDDASKSPIYAGWGSGGVIAPYLVTPLTGIKSRVASNVTVTYTDSSNINNAVAAAQAADVAIVCVGVTSGEGSDRANLGLGGNSDSLVSAVAGAQPNTVVVVHAPGAVLMPWSDQVQSILTPLLPGQEDGNALAAVLFGDVNPSGRLPVTFPAQQSQNPLNTTQQYPGVNGDATYSEKLLVGYRWFDAYGQTPLFPFGHGLSYTSFKYGNLVVSGSVYWSSGAIISADISNSGNVAGAEVVQLYLGYPTSAKEPPKVLRGFQKVFLWPGQTENVVFTVREHDVSIWDITEHDWSIVTGTFTVSVGSSSRDIRLQGNLKV